MVYYKFKDNKHSVIMRILSVDEKTGNCLLENKDYPIQYEANIKDLEKVEYEI